MNQLGALGFSVQLQDMAKFARDLQDAQRMTAAAATGMASQMGQVTDMINQMADAEKARASLFDRTLQESGRLMDVFKRGVKETADALDNLKIDPDSMKVPQQALQSMKEWRDQAAYAMGAAAAVGWEKTKTAWEEFKQWSEREVVIWGVALAVGVSAAVLSAVYAAYKGISFAVGLLTGDSYKSKNIDALVAANDQVKQLQGQLHIAAQDATALADALNRLGVPKEDYVTVWTQAASAVRANTDELDRLGIKYKDNEGKLLDTRTFLENVRTALDSYKEGWDRSQAEAAIGVGSYEKVTQTLKVTAGQIEQSRARLNDFNLGIGPDTQAAVANYQRAMREFDNESKLTSDGFKRAIADNIMPLLADLADFFQEGFPIAVNAFRYTIAEITSLFYGMKTVIYMVAESIVGSISSIGSVMGGLATAAGKAMTGDFTGAKDALVQGWTDAKDRLGKIGDNIVTQARNNAAAMRLAWAMDDRSGAGALPTGGGKPWTPAPPKPQDSGTQADPFAAVVKSISERTAAENLELSTQEKLTAGQQFAIKILDDVRTGTLKLTEAKSELLGKLLEEMLNTEKDVDLHKLEREALAEAAKAHEDLIRELDAGTKQILQELDAQTAHNTAMVAGKEAAAGLTAAKLDEQATSLETLAIRKREKDLDEGVYQLYIDQAKALRDLADAKRLGGQLEDQKKAFESVWSSIDQTARSVFTNIAQGGSNAFRQLGQTLKTAVLDLLYQMTVRKWLINIVASVTGTNTGVASAVAAQSGSGLGNLLSAGSSALGGTGLLGSMGGFGQAMGATMSNGLISGFGANMANIGTLAGGGEIMGAIGAAIPYVGIAIAVASLIAGLFGKGGGPKQDGVFGRLDSGIGLGQRSTASDAAAQQSATTIQSTYDSIVKAYGGSGGLQYGLGFSMDPQGTSQSFVDITASRGNQTAYTDLNLNAGRSQQELTTAIGDMTTRAILAGLQQSNLQGKIGDFLKGLGDVGKLSLQDATADLARVQKAMTEKQSLEDQIFQLTATDEQKVTKARQDELAALDDSNKALGQSVFALQDQAAATAAAAQAAQQALAASQQGLQFISNLRLNVGQYIDKLNATPAGMLSPEQQLQNARAQFDKQIQLARQGDTNAIGSISNYGDQLISAQTAYSASGGGTQDTISYVKSALANLPNEVSLKDVVTYLDGIKTNTFNTVEELKLTPGQIQQELKNSFAAIDTNASGGVDPQELKTWLGQRADDATIARVFAALDRQYHFAFGGNSGAQDGVITQQEANITVSPMATGGIMTSMGPLPLHSYASGGIATRPQLALFGEASMNEAFVPLPDGRRIPVNMGGGMSALLDEVRALRTEVQQLRATSNRGNEILATYARRDLENGEDLAASARETAKKSRLDASRPNTGRRGG